ncbi:MAG: polyprenol monophosphomannose synthase [Saprospiraceae bacterium]
MGKYLVIIPTYNEIENIRAIIDAALSQGPLFEVLIIDDNSPDGTAEEVKKMMLEKVGKIHILERSGKLGLGTAYIAGFKRGLELGATHLFEMDADFSHNPNDLNRLLQPLLDKKANVSVGSRYTKGGGIKNWPVDRLILSYGASLYVRLITWLSVKDSTAGFVCYEAQVLKTIPLDKISFVGYAFQIEMKYAAIQNGFKIAEVPIVFADREKGKSKMHSGIIFEAITGVLTLRARGFKNYYKALVG